MSNIMLAGVGGQGLVLMTRILTQAALNDGFDVKSNDVVGLSQRGGMVWGNVKFASKVYSPNILPGSADILVSLEPLEALRQSSLLKPEGIILMNTRKVQPTSVQQERDPYPDAAIAIMKQAFKTLEVDAFMEAKKIGKKQVANVIMLGMLSAHIELSSAAWEQSLQQTLAPHLLELNVRAFWRGCELGSEPGLSLILAAQMPCN